MKWEVSTPPEGTIFTDDVLSLHLRLDTDADLSLVQLYADAAVDYAQDAMGCSLLPQTITATFYEHDHDKLFLPRGPITYIISATDTNEKDVTFRRETYGHADKLVPLVSFVAPLTVIYTAGYPDAAGIPAGIRAAILAHVGTLYDRRESVSDRANTVVPHSLDAFYAMKARRTSIG